VHWNIIRGRSPAKAKAGGSGTDTMTLTMPWVLFCPAIPVIVHLSRSPSPSCQPGEFMARVVFATSPVGLRMPLAGVPPTASGEVALRYLVATKARSVEVGGEGNAEKLKSRDAEMLRWAMSCQYQGPTRYWGGYGGRAQGCA